MRGIKNQIVWAFFLSLLVSSCGPMNQDLPSSPASAPGASDLSDGTSESIGFSKSHAFIVVSNLKAAAANLTAADELRSRPQLGNNVYRFRILHESDFTAPAESLHVVVNVKHEKVGSNYRPVTVEKQADGSYLATLPFKKIGAYDIQVILSEGNLKDDEHDFRVTL